LVYSFYEFNLLPLDGEHKFGLICHFFELHGRLEEVVVLHLYPLAAKRLVIIELVIVRPQLHGLRLLTDKEIVDQRLQWLDNCSRIVEVRGYLLEGGV
jgi:hypothetical protein